MPIEDRKADLVPGWTDILSMAQTAEAIGFDSFWVPDHLTIEMPLPGWEPSGAWECWSLLAALAATTSRIKIGSLVTCTAFRNPALLAKMAETVDEISGGRLTLGLGAGWCEPEFRAFGFPFDRRVSRFEEALTIIGGLIHQGHVDFHGQFHFAHDCELRPRGPRPRGLPILIGATAGDRMMRLAASHADTWNRDVDGINPGFEPYSKEDLAAWRPRIDAVCAGVGRDPATLSRSAHVFVDLPGSPGRPGFGALAGEPAEIAAGLLTYAQAGFDHLQLWVEPNTAAGVAALAPILAELDQT